MCADAGMKRKAQTAGGSADMDFLVIAFIAIITTIVMILIGIPIAYSIGICTVGAIIIGLGAAPLAKVGLIPFTVFYSLNWIPLPLFLLMACIICETKIGEDIFGTANKWLSRVPGGLLVASVVGQGLMAATMGNSGTTILTVGTIVEPEVKKLRYNREFSMSALLAGGVLGPLIPPSVNFIVYAVIAQASVSQLFLAGVMPGILLIVLLCAFIMITCVRHRDYAPTPIHVSWKERFSSLKKTWPILVLILGIIGGIYSGAVTATEAGAVGVVLTLVIAVAFYKFRLPQLKRAMGQAATLTAMVSMMIIAVNSFTYIVAVSGMSDALSNFVAGLNASPILVVIIINIILLILGCIMDGLAIMMVTMPLFVPLIVSLGFDPVWFGVLVCVNIEIGLITPPVGLNLFMVSGTFGVQVSKLIRAIFPFLVLLLIFLALLIAFPQISTWLPNLSRAS